MKRLEDEYKNFHMNEETRDMLKIYAADQIDNRAIEELDRAIERDLAMHASKAKSPYHLNRAALLGPDAYNEEVRSTMSKNDVIRQLAFYQSMTPAIGKQPLNQIRKRQSKSYESKTNIIAKKDRSMASLKINVAN